MNEKTLSLLVFFLSFLILLCSPSENFVVLHQVTGPIETNCYLLYDIESKEAALIDIGGPIDSLVTYIDNNNLKLKYIFATHCHLDHIDGIPAIRDKYPSAELCLNKRDYQDFLDAPSDAEKNLDPGELAQLKEDPFFRKWFEYDPNSLKGIDIYLEDNQIHRLGNLEIRTILSPGHSRGSVCYHVNDVLFSGDVLFHRRVGRTDLFGGSGEAIVKSVRRLYTQLADETTVYPGHGQFTDIGSEKIENEEVTIDKVNLQN